MSPSWIPAAISATCMVVSLAVTAIQSIRMRAYERRLEQMNLLVVRSVMEESPQIVDRVLETAERLRRTDTYHFEGPKALAAARRLHGLDP